VIEPFTFLRLKVPPDFKGNTLENSSLFSLPKSAERISPEPEEASAVRGREERNKIKRAIKGMIENTFFEFIDSSLNIILIIKTHHLTL
jgi:hypothetical protein